MKELLKRIKREIEQELLRIRNELKNIDKNINEHNYYLLKNREGFLVFDLETLKKGINNKSIETILRHLRIEDEDTKATKIDILKIGQYFLDQKLVFKTIEIYEKFVKNKKNIENFNLLGAKTLEEGDPKASLMLKSFDKKEVEEIIKRAKKDKNFNLLLNANLQKKVQSKNEVGDLDEIK